MVESAFHSRDCSHHLTWLSAAGIIWLGWASFNSGASTERFCPCNWIAWVSPSESIVTTAWAVLDVGGLIGFASSQLCKFYWVSAGSINEWWGSNKETPSLISTIEMAALNALSKRGLNLKQLITTLPVRCHFGALDIKMWLNRLEWLLHMCTIVERRLAHLQARLEHRDVHLVLKVYAAKSEAPYYSNSRLANLTRTPRSFDGDILHWQKHRNRRKKGKRTSLLVYAAKEIIEPTRPSRLWNRLIHVKWNTPSQSTQSQRRIRAAYNTSSPSPLCWNSNSIKNWKLLWKLLWTLREVACIHRCVFETRKPFISSFSAEHVANCTLCKTVHCIVALASSYCHMTRLQ